MASISHETAANILASFRIPPRPTVLIELQEEQKQKDPDLRTIARIISKDVVLSAAMLKTVNSPYFGLRRKIDSIEQAVLTMGSNNVFNIMTALALRNLNVNQGAQLERFWDTAQNTANNAVMLAKRIPGIPHDVAYTVGLFHDCGIPLMMTRFPDYRETLKSAQNQHSGFITDIEDECHNTNHATVGHLLSRNWCLSENIALTILHHHNLDIFSSREVLPAEVCGLIAVIQIAEALSDSTQMRDSDALGKNAPLLLSYLGISKQELDDITDEIMECRAA